MDVLARIAAVWGKESPEYAAVSDLIAAGKGALENDGGTRYEGEDDEIGSHACCLELSFKPHAADCWVSRLQKAIKTTEVV